MLPLEGLRSSFPAKPECNSWTELSLVWGVTEVVPGVFDFLQSSYHLSWFAKIWGFKLFIFNFILLY